MDLRKIRLGLGPWYIDIALAVRRAPLNSHGRQIVRNTVVYWQEKLIEYQ